MTKHDLDFSGDSNEFYQTINVTLPNDDAQYVLHTASGADATRYQNLQADSIIFRDGKPVGMKPIADLEPRLISFCLKKVVDGKHKEVKISDIGNLPFPVQRKLYEAALDISKLRTDGALSDLLYEAFEQEEHEPPCSLEDLRSWLDLLNQDKFGNLVRLFSPGELETGKKS